MSDLSIMGVNLHRIEGGQWADLSRSGSPRMYRGENEWIAFSIVEARPGLWLGAAQIQGNSLRVTGLYCVSPDDAARQLTIALTLFENAVASTRRDGAELMECPACSGYGRQLHLDSGPCAECDGTGRRKEESQ